MLHNYSQWGKAGIELTGRCGGRGGLGCTYGKTAEASQIADTEPFRLKHGELAKEYKSTVENSFCRYLLGGRSFAKSSSLCKARLILTIYGGARSCILERKGAARLDKQPCPLVLLKMEEDI